MEPSATPSVVPSAATVDAVINASFADVSGMVLTVIAVAAFGLLVSLIAIKLATAWALRSTRV